MIASNCQTHLSEGIPPSYSFFVFSHFLFKKGLPRLHLVLHEWTSLSGRAQVLAPFAAYSADVRSTALQVTVLFRGSRVRERGPSKMIYLIAKQLCCNITAHKYDNIMLSRVQVHSPMYARAATRPAEKKPTK